MLFLYLLTTFIPRVTKPRIRLAVTRFKLRVTTSRFRSSVTRLSHTHAPTARGDTPNFFYRALHSTRGHGALALMPPKKYAPTSRFSKFCRGRFDPRQGIHHGPRAGLNLNRGISAKALTLFKS
jgi:hypothetical protein